MKNISSYITFLLFGLIWIKCSDEFSTYSEINRENHTSDYDRLSLKNFPRLENPYSISNMEKALVTYTLFKKSTFKNPDQLSHDLKKTRKQTHQNSGRLSTQKRL